MDGVVVVARVGIGRVNDGGEGAEIMVQLLVLRSQPQTVGSAVSVDVGIGVEADRFAVGMDLAPEAVE